MGTDFNKDTGLAEMSKLPGISDLASAVKVPFIKALKAEDAGNMEEAKLQLDKAVQVEQDALSSQKK